MKYIAFALCLLLTGTATAADPFRSPGVCLSPINPFQDGIYNAHGAMCPGSPYEYPIVCVPEHTLPSGVTVPEQCAEIGPNSEDVAIGITLANTQTGYRAPEPVIQAAIAQLELTTLFGTLWAYYTRGAYPEYQSDYRLALDEGQISEALTTLGEFYLRDNGTQHELFTYRSLRDRRAALSRLCPGQPNNSRCVGVVELILYPLELASSHYNRNWRHSLSYAQYEQLFEILLRAPAVDPEDAVCGRPPICGVR